MRVMNKVVMRNCDQWLADYVKRIVKKAKLNCDEVVITDFDGKVITLSIDGDEDTYKVLISGGESYETDNSGLPWSEKLHYVLCKKTDETTYTGILTGKYKVSWDNRFEEYFSMGIIAGFVRDILEQKKMDITNAVIKWCYSSCIALGIDGSDYRISVWRFPVTDYDANGLPVSCRVTYDFAKVESDYKTGGMRLVPIISRGISDISL